MDDCIGRVLRALTEQGLAESTGIVVVADHGESLGDHGERTHALQLYNSTLQVPLVVRLPWLNGQRPRVDRSVSNADVMPTVLEALGIDPAGLGLTVQGRSLLPLLEPGSGSTIDQPEDRLLYFETFYPYHHYRWSPLSGFVLGSRKFIHGPYDELFDLSTDMAERSPTGTAQELAAQAARLGELEPSCAMAGPR
jgi:arylsulfatase A-like enzyme